jgi:hypothetical protein
VQSIVAHAPCILTTTTATATITVTVTATAIIVATDAHITGVSLVPGAARKHRVTTSTSINSSDSPSIYSLDYTTAIHPYRLR